MLHKCYLIMLCKYYVNVIKMLYRCYINVMWITIGIGKIKND